MGLIIPKKLRKGSTIATVSTSWGGAGELRYRYEIGKKRLIEEFGLNVIEMNHTLKSSERIYNNLCDQLKFGQMLMIGNEKYYSLKLQKKVFLMIILKEL